MHASHLKWRTVVNETPNCLFFLLKVCTWVFEITILNSESSFSVMLEQAVSIDCYSNPMEAILEVATNQFA